MGLKKDIIKERLKETFGNDTQTVIGKKINVVQGTVSKVLSGDQEPTAEMLYNVAQVYEVSVDWLMGLSDVRQIPDPNPVMTYGDILKTFAKYGELGIVYPYPKSFVGNDGDVELAQIQGMQIGDEILQAILYEWTQMTKMQPDMYQMIRDKRILDYSKIPYMPWSDGLKILFNQMGNVADASPDKLKKLYETYKEELKKEQETRNVSE